jgi:hypothetical protein
MKKKVAIVLLLVALFAAQAISDAPVKESEFTFARVQFNMKLAGLYRDEAPWHHDYPFSEDFVLNFIREITSIATNADSYQIVELESEDIFDYPFLYFSEPGFWDVTDQERVNLREWFDRGGFAMFDDFRGSDLTNLRFQMKEVYPERDMVRLDISEEIFHSYYDIDTLQMDAPYGPFAGVNRQPDDRFSNGPEFWGMKDDDGRLILIANQNNDFGEFFEWVDRGEMPFEPAAKSARLMINYLLYAMTH